MIRIKNIVPKMLKKSMNPCGALKYSTIITSDEMPKTTTIDQGEVDRHSKLSQSWWDPNGSLKALHSYNHLRVPFVRDGLVDNVTNQNILTPLLGKKILDVGCGGGILSEALAGLGAEVTGLEPSKDLVQIAVEHSRKNEKLKTNLPKYICTSVEEHAKELSEYYDGVVASEVIEHVNNKELFVESCVQVLKPGGRIFITTPMRSRISKIFVVYLAEYVLKIIPLGTHDFKKFLTPKEMSYLLDTNNCSVEKKHGIIYNFLTNRWSIINSKQFIFFMQAVKA